MNKNQHLYLNALGLVQWQLQNKPCPSVTRNKKAIEHLNWQALQTAVVQCSACRLHESRTQTVFGVGSTKADLMIIGEAPGFYEDQQGEPFVGRAGQLLTAMLKAIKKERSQVYIANILKCRPPQNRDPLPQEVAECTPFL